MKIAMIGQKGIPATYGGIERHVEELAAGLAERGHDVTVYCRPWYVRERPATHRGVRLEYRPSIPTKHLDAITHAIVCALDASRRAVDIVHFHAVGPALAAFIARRHGVPVVVTIHGRDWQRAKWGPLAAAVLRRGERAAMRKATAVISVSGAVANELEVEYRRRPDYVPNGIVLAGSADAAVFDEIGVRPRRYVLFAGRLVPEKGAHHLIEAWRRLGGYAGMNLVVAGDTSHSSDYVRLLRESAPESVRFPGYVYGERLAALYREAALLVLPSELEGLSIVLLEAAAHGAPVLASDIGPNREVMGAEGRYFRSGDVAHLAERLREALSDPGAVRPAAERLAARVRRVYSWKRAVEATEAIYRRVLATPRSG